MKKGSCDGNRLVGASGIAGGPGGGSGNGRGSRRGRVHLHSHACGIVIWSWRGHSLAAWQGHHAEPHHDPEDVVQPRFGPSPADPDFFPYLTDVSRGRQLGAKQHLEQEHESGSAGICGLGAVPQWDTERDQPVGLPGCPGDELVGWRRGVQPVVRPARDSPARTVLGLLPAVFLPGAVGCGARPGGEPGRSRHRPDRSTRWRDQAAPPLSRT